MHHILEVKKLPRVRTDQALVKPTYNGEARLNFQNLGRVIPWEVNGK